MAGHAEGHYDLSALVRVVQQRRCGERLSETLDHHMGPAFGSIRQDDAEPAAAHPRGDVCGAGVLQKEPAEGGQEPVTRREPGDVVDVVQGLDFDCDQGERALKPLRGVKFPLQPVHQIAAVEQLGEFVAHGPVLKLHVVDKQAEPEPFLLVDGLPAGHGGCREGIDRRS